MGEMWQTKYGPRRVRREAPTLDEAIFAAMGITDDLGEQAEIAASLMGLPVEKVEPEVKKNARATLRVTRVIAGEQGAQRSVVVERKRVNRRIVPAAPKILGNDSRF